jgi:hypothetical protein
VAREKFSSSSGLGFILCEKSSPAKKKFQNDGAWENFFYGTDEHILEQRHKKFLSVSAE